jgi:hypothetical protein
VGEHRTGDLSSTADEIAEADYVPYLPHCVRPTGHSALFPANCSTGVMREN